MTPPAPWQHPLLLRSALPSPPLLHSARCACALRKHAWLLSVRPWGTHAAHPSVTHPRTRTRTPTHPYTSHLSLSPSLSLPLSHPHTHTPTHPYTSHLSLPLPLSPSLSHTHTHTQSGVTALRFNASGALLGSGAKDTDVIVWDVVGETGLFRLRGHKDQVTDLVSALSLRAHACLRACVCGCAWVCWDEGGKSAHRPGACHVPVRSCLPLRVRACACVQGQRCCCCWWWWLRAWAWCACWAGLAAWRWDVRVWIPAFTVVWIPVLTVQGVWAKVVAQRALSLPRQPWRPHFHQCAPALLCSALLWPYMPHLLAHAPPFAADVCVAPRGRVRPLILRCLLLWLAGEQQ